MNISIIAAISENLVIGNNNSIPWKLPKDLKWFKEKTINKSIIMGRLTWDTIKHELPMRQNIILTRKFIKNYNNVYFANSIQNAIKLAKNKKEIMIIGGGQLYSQMLSYANKLYLTKIKINIKGDTYFPKYQHIKWNKIFLENHEINEKNKYNFQFQILERSE
ncbi:MAG: type 3 dihydrofolate reductase [Buchnera aphidicola (Schlechtendalia chinensis)]